MSKKRSFTVLGECFVQISHDFSTKHARFETTVENEHLCRSLSYYRKPLGIEMNYLSTFSQSCYSQEAKKILSSAHIQTEHSYFDNSTNMKFRLATHLDTALLLQEELSLQKTLPNLGKFLSGIQQIVRESDYFLFNFSFLAPLPFDMQAKMLAILHTARAHNTVIILNKNTFLPPDLEDQYFSLTDILMTDLNMESIPANARSIETRFMRYEEFGISEVLFQSNEPYCWVVSPRGMNQVSGSLPTETPHYLQIDNQRFKAGYLAGKIKGLSPALSARCGYRLMQNRQDYPILF